MTAEDKRTLDASIAYAAKMGLTFEPYTQAIYSGRVAFDVLTKIVELVSKENFARYLTEHVLAPCDMLDSGMIPTQGQWNRMIAMHDYRDGKAVMSPTVFGCVFEDYPCTHLMGGAGLFSTLEDYAHFAEMLRMEGEWKGRRILSRESVREMATPQVSVEQYPGYRLWGLGVRVIVNEKYRIRPVGSYGWSGAYGTHFWVDPVNQVTAVYLKNSRYDGGSGALTSQHFEEDIHAAIENS